MYDYFGTGESVEENANLVIRLLIRRPECLGPALRGEGEGLLRAIIDANKVPYFLCYLIKLCSNILQTAPDV